MFDILQAIDPPAEVCWKQNMKYFFKLILQVTSMLRECFGEDSKTEVFALEYINQREPWSTTTTDNYYRK